MTWCLGILFGHKVVYRCKAMLLSLLEVTVLLLHLFTCVICIWLASVCINLRHKYLAESQPLTSMYATATHFYLCEFLPVW